MLKIRLFLVIVIILSCTKKATAFSLSTKPNSRFINSCEQIGDRAVPSDRHISDKLNKSNQKKQAQNITRQSGLIPLPQKSIWWAAKQFDPFDGKLIRDWLTHAPKQQINLIVDLQLWTLLDYLGRYSFVNQFGTVVRQHGYTLNIVNQKQQCLATYRYNSVSNPPRWELHLQQLGRDSLQLDRPRQQQTLPQLTTDQ